MKEASKKLQDLFEPDISDEIADKYAEFTTNLADHVVTFPKVGVGDLVESMDFAISNPNCVYIMDVDIVWFFKDENAAINKMEKELEKLQK